jgi:hypothetical protein
MPQKLTQVQHVQKRYVLHLRVEAGQVVSQRLARDQVVMSVLSRPNSRAYDRREEQTIVARIADGGRGTSSSNRRGRTDDLGDYGTVND